MLYDMLAGGVMELTHVEVNGKEGGGMAVLGYIAVAVTGWHCGVLLREVEGVPMDISTDTSCASSV